MSTVTAQLPSSPRLFLRRKRAQTKRTARNLAVKFGPYELCFNQSRPLSKSDALDYRTLFPAKLMSFEGRDLDYLKASKWFNEGTYNRTEAFSCNLQNVRLHVGSGVLANSDNVLIDDSALEHGRLTEMPVYGARVPSHYTHIGRASTIRHGWANNYYHWLIDCTSRLYALKDVGETQLLMPAGLKRVLGTLNI